MTNPKPPYAGPRAVIVTRTTTLWTGLVIPVGLIMDQWQADRWSIPSLPCDGRAITKTAHPDLWECLSAATPVRVPDLRSGEKCPPASTPERTREDTRGDHE